MREGRRVGKGPWPDATHIDWDRVNDWARKRQQMALAYLEWLAATARLDRATLCDLERLYPDLGRYAKLGEPLRECSATQLRAIASGMVLLISEEDLTPYLSAVPPNALEDPKEVERRILVAWLSRPVK